MTGAANPEVYFRMRGWRGFGENIQLSGWRNSFESLFKDMFYGFDDKAGILIRIKDSASGDRTLRIFYGRNEPYTLPLKGRSDNVFRVDPLHFTWKTSTKTIESKIYIEEGNLKIKGGDDVYPAILVSPQTVNPKQNALRFSELSKAKRQHLLLEAVRKIFPSVDDITLETVAGDVMLYASLLTLPEKIPIAVISSGLNKYLSIVLAILENNGGAVLVDEIENGFYYKALTPMLESIISLCEEHNVQLIASTHSYELLQALVPVISNGKEREEHLSLLRLTMMEDGHSEVKHIRGASYKSAIEQGFEVR